MNGLMSIIASVKYVKLHNKDDSLFMSTDPHPCKHGPDMFDAKDFTSKLPKMTGEVSSVYSTITINRMEKKPRQQRTLILHSLQPMITYDCSVHGLCSLC